MGSLSGQVAIVTGASRGIGYAIAEAFVREGASVCITGRKQDALDTARVALGGPVLTIAGNTSDEEHRRAAVGATLAEFRRLDILVNNTGINPAYGPLIEIDLGALRKTYDTNVVSALGWVQEAHAQAFGAGGGTVVNVASVAGLRPAENIGGYAASKAGLIALTQQLAAELGPGVRVNAVAPAVVRTDFAKALYEKDEQGIAGRYPLKRLGAPEDIAGAVLFLASPAAAWITGETLVVDGGLLLKFGL
jgi:3-oxoacyl-[acyl-carrier protein] reductase